MELEAESGNANICGEEWDWARLDVQPEREWEFRSDSAGQWLPPRRRAFHYRNRRPGRCERSNWLRECQRSNADSKIELIDIGFVEEERFAEENVIALNLEFANGTSLERGSASF